MNLSFPNIAAKRDWHPIRGDDFLNISFVKNTEEQFLRGNGQAPLRIEVVPVQPDVLKRLWNNGQIEFSIESIVRHVEVSKRRLKSWNRPQKGIFFNGKAGEFSWKATEIKHTWQVIPWNDECLQIQRQPTGVKGSVESIVPDVDVDETSWKRRRINSPSEEQVGDFEVF